jgi:phosphoribosylpyrophosphate synthetase
MSIEMPRCQFKMTSTLLNCFDTLKLDKDHTLVVSPDETGVSRAIFYASHLNLPLSLFYRKYTGKPGQNGKIFEYLAARRPVLGIGQERGAAVRLLTETGSGVMYDWDRLDPLRNYIDSAWERHLSGEDGPLQTDVSEYSREALTEKLSKVL